MNHPLANLWRFKVEAAGELVEGRRRFRVAYRAGRRLSLSLDASAPAADFVELEREGATTIHTTLFGHCRLTARAPDLDETLTSTGTCLLEAKSSSEASPVLVPVLVPAPRLTSD